MGLIKFDGFKQELENLENFDTSNWKYEASLAEFLKPDGGIDLSHVNLAKAIMSKYIIRTMNDNEEIYFYDNGVYSAKGEELVKAESQKITRKVAEVASESENTVLRDLTSYKINETLNFIRRDTYIAREKFDCNKAILNLGNGFLDLQTMELNPHSPSIISTVRIPVVHNPMIDCSRIRQFLNEILGPEDVSVIEELFGYCLTQSYQIQKAFLFIGGGANGKTTLIELLRYFLGRENCSSIPLQALETQRFASSVLYSKLANLYADLPSSSLKNVGIFKMLTGGDTVSAEKKFKDSFSFINYAKLIFSANQPPKIVGEDTYAFWRRWVIIDFPNEFPEEKADKNMIDKLTTTEELSGLLNVALEGLKRLQENGRFSQSKTTEEIADRYLKAADPVYAFVMTWCKRDPAAWTSKDDLHHAFENYCWKEKIPFMRKDSFARALTNLPGVAVRSEKHRILGYLTPGWVGIRLKREGEESDED